MLERLCVSYLQQVCEKQHPQITELRGDPEQFDSYSQLKSQMLKAITKRHPWLAPSVSGSRLSETAFFNPFNFCYFQTLD